MLAVASRSTLSQAQPPALLSVAAPDRAAGSPRAKQESETVKLPRGREVGAMTVEVIVLEFVSYAIPV